MTTKRQHLVWRKYLAQWTDDISSTEGNISWFFKDKNQIMQRQSINDVAVERYTYDISMINETDKKIVRQYYDKWLKSQSFLQLKSRINDTEDIFKKDYIENNYICPIEDNGIDILNDLYEHQFPFDGPTLLEETVDLLKKHLLSCLYLNEPMLDDETLLSLSQYAVNNEETDKRYNFYEFVSVQMLRTWKSKDVTNNSIKDTIAKYQNSDLKNTSEAIFPLMMIVNSTILATSFCKNNFYIQLIDNKTNQDFITGDFPVINLCANYNELDKPIEKMELYYPISPRIAIICKNNIKCNETIELNDETVVDIYNKKIFDAAVKQVFASKDSDLEKYKNK